jgi:hypothetical protein
MSCHDNARTTTQQGQRLRQRPPYRVQAHALVGPGRLVHDTREMPSVFIIRLNILVPSSVWIWSGFSRRHSQSSEMDGGRRHGAFSQRTVRLVLQELARLIGVSAVSSRTLVKNAGRAA